MSEEPDFREGNIAHGQFLLCVRVTLGKLYADEFHALMLFDEARDRFDKEHLQSWRQP